MTFPFLKKRYGDRQLHSISRNPGSFRFTTLPSADVAIFSSSKATTGVLAIQDVGWRKEEDYVTFLSREYSMSTENSSTSLCGPWSGRPQTYKVAESDKLAEGKVPIPNSVFYLLNKMDEWMFV